MLYSCVQIIFPQNFGKILLDNLLEFIVADEKCVILILVPLQVSLFTFLKGFYDFDFIPGVIKFSRVLLVLFHLLLVILYIIH